MHARGDIVDLIGTGLCRMHAKCVMNVWFYPRSVLKSRRTPGKPVALVQIRRRKNTGDRVQISLILVTTVLIKFTGENVRLYEEESIGKEIVDEIKNELEMQGYPPKHIDLSVLSIVTVNEINNEIEKLKAAYAEISNEL